MKELMQYIQEKGIDISTPEGQAAVMEAADVILSRMRTKDISGCTLVSGNDTIH